MPAASPSDLSRFDTALLNSLIKPKPILSLIPNYVPCLPSSTNFFPLLSIPLNPSEILPNPTNASRTRLLHLHLKHFRSYPNIPDDILHVLLEKLAPKSAKPIDRLVLVKHRVPGARGTKAGVSHAAQHRLRLLGQEVPGSDVKSHHLDVAVIENGEISYASLDMGAPDIAVMVCVCVKRGDMAVWKEADKVVLAVKEGEERDSVGSILRWWVNWRSGREIVENYDAYTKDWVYEVVRRRKSDYDKAQWEQWIDHVKQCHALNVDLRAYQQRAVAWMMGLERGESPYLYPDQHFRQQESTEPADGFNVMQDVVINLMGKVEGGMGKAKNASKIASKRRKEEVAWGKGGLLCDEMGLGKTVELMQLVACNPKQGALEEVVPPIPYEEGVCGACERRIQPKEPYAVCGECRNAVHESCGGIQRSSKKDFVCAICCDEISQTLREGLEHAQLPKSRATVVVVPTTLLYQWKQELSKHVKNALDIVVFQGLKNSGYLSRSRLMQADIVLTTYEALARDVEVFKSLKFGQRRLRYEKKYPLTPIPLLTIHWHRLALDESQMLGSKGANKAAEMAGFFKATYKWCVTGTPIHLVATELVPMLNVLGIRGGDYLADWQMFLKPSCLLEDEKRLQYKLRQIMWRTSKEDVEESEISLPPQTIEVVHTRFGPVEKYHFQLLLESAKDMLVDYRTRQQNGHREALSAELMTMLRQACCHPQIGMSGRQLASQAARTAFRSNPKSKAEKKDAVQDAMKRAERPLDMNDVLNMLVAKAGVQLSEALRLHVAANNGLAAVSWLQQSILSPRSNNVEGLVAAVRLYRETLNLVEENKELVKMDNIQRMHVLVNLKEALDSVAKKSQSLVRHPSESAQKARESLEALGSTLRDHNLPSEIDGLKKSYLGEAKQLLLTSQALYIEAYSDLGEEPLIPNEDYSDNEESPNESALEVIPHLETQAPSSKRKGKPTRKNTEVSVQSRTHSDPLQWWDIAIASLMHSNEERQEAFLSRLIEQLLEGVPGMGLGEHSVARRLSSVLSLTLVVRGELHKLQAARTALKNKLLNLPGSVEPTAEEVAESGQCQVCREFGQGAPCGQCRTEIEFKAVEEKLYRIRLERKKDQDKRNARRRRRAMEREGLDSAKAIMSNALNPKASIVEAARAQGGLRLQSEIETIMKALAGVVRQRKDPDLDEQVTSWFETLEMLKNEQTAARNLLLSQRAMLARMDEVNMAIMRFSVLNYDEDVYMLTEEEKRHRLPSSSLPSLRLQFLSEKKQTTEDFRNKRGKLVYLKGLQRSAQSPAENGKESGVSHEVQYCAVCLMEFNEEVTRVAVFGCGHVFCCECTSHMISKSSEKRKMSTVRCPTCRVVCPVEEISFTMNVAGKSADLSVEEDANNSEEIDASEKDEVEPVNGKRTRTSMKYSPRKVRKVNDGKSRFYDSSASVAGLVGAKTSAIVRTLRGIWKYQEDVKVLIFSEWHEVLDLVSRALEMNEVLHINTEKKSGAAFSEAVDKFKTSEVINVLLLPLKKAGAGLNLTEAKHVILVEPSMNLSLEAQAVGRVHRIGQTSETFVHRIIVRDTIEEDVLALGDAYRGNEVTFGTKDVKIWDVLRALDEGAQRNGTPSSSGSSGRED